MSNTVKINNVKVEILFKVDYDLSEREKILNKIDAIMSYEGLNIDVEMVQGHFHERENIQVKCDMSQVIQVTSIMFKIMK